MSRDPRYQRLLNSRRWFEVKKIVWQRSGGLCERCRREGIAAGILPDGYITPGVDCHHIKPVEGARTEDGPDGMKARCYNPDNIELLCVPCHIKTHQEMRSHTKEQVQANKARGAERRASWLDPNYDANKDGRDNERPQGQDVDSHEDGQRWLPSSAEHDEG